MQSTNDTEVIRFAFAGLVCVYIPDWSVFSHGHVV